MERFRNKVVVVIGGNSGIGLAAAKAFAVEGARLVITGRDPETLEKATKEIGHLSTSHRSDIRDLQQTRSLFRKLADIVSHIDVLFVNAGVLSISPIESVTESDWDYVQDTNLKGVFFVVQSAVSLMPKGSSIVLTGSTAGRLGVPTASVYSASKAALSSLGRSLGAELLPRGIRVNVVSPGPTDTPIYHRATGLTPEGANALVRSEVDSSPMKRMGTPAEVAAAVLFLASNDAAFISGVDLLVGGGTGSF